MLEFLAGLAAFYFYYRTGLMLSWALGPNQDNAVAQNWLYFFGSENSTFNSVVDGLTRGGLLAAGVAYVPESHLATALIFNTCVTMAFMCTAFNRYEIQKKELPKK